MNIPAQVVELVDTPAWGAGALKGVQVRILSRAQKKNLFLTDSFLFVSF